MKEYIEIEKQLPRENQNVFIFYNSEDVIKRTRGFYFTNGLKPTFASYGSDIQNVVGWLPR